MIAAVAWLLTCQLLGEVLVRALALPLPGPVAGMALMFVFLVFQGRHKAGDNRVPDKLGSVADVLLGNLSLLFIPAAVGIVQYFKTLNQFGWAIAVSIFVSTLAAMLSTVFVFRLVVKTQNHFRRREHAVKESEVGSKS